MTKRNITIALGVIVAVATYLYYTNTNANIATGSGKKEQKILAEEAKCDVPTESEPKKIMITKDTPFVDPVPMKNSDATTMPPKARKIDDNLRAVRRGVHKDLVEAEVELASYKLKGEVLQTEMEELDKMIEETNAKEGIDGDAVKAEIEDELNAPVTTVAAKKIKSELEKTEEKLLVVEEALDSLDIESGGE